MKNTLLISSSITLRQKVSVCIASLIMLAGFAGPLLTEELQQHPYYESGVITSSMPMIHLEVSPNPTTSTVHIAVQGQATEKYAIRIVDMLGKTRCNKALPPDGRLKLDVSSWAKGIYLVQVEDDPSMTAERLIIN